MLVAVVLRALPDWPLPFPFFFGAVLLGAAVLPAPLALLLPFFLGLQLEEGLEEPPLTLTKPGGLRLLVAPLALPSVTFCLGLRLEEGLEEPPFFPTELLFCTERPNAERPDHLRSFLVSSSARTAAALRGGRRL